MPTIFSQARGRVAVLDEPNVGGQIALVDVPDWSGTSAIITRCTVSQAGNFQFLHTLGQFIYVYVFGDRMGSLGLSGLAFHQNCDGGGQGAQGINQVLEFYKTNRIAKRQTPLRITLGGGPTLEAFLVGGTSDVVEPYDKIWQFDFQFALIPPAD